MESSEPVPEGSSSDSYTSLSNGSMKNLTETLVEATSRVLRRRFRVLLLIRDAYTHMLENANVLGAVWDDLRATLRLLVAWVDRSYHEISWGSVAILVAALVYFVTPVDVIPDALGAIGFVDDVAVITTAVETVRGELDRFRAWEKTKTNLLAS